MTMGYVSSTAQYRDVWHLSRVRVRVCDRWVFCAVLCGTKSVSAGR